MTGPEDDAGLAGKVALISGGGAAGDGIGNGRAAAILLARAGVKVLVADRDLALAERTAEMIRTEGGTAAAIASDVTSEAECKALVEASVDRFGRLDYLDNNVGIGSRGSVVDEKPEEYRRVMQVNVETMFLLSKYAIPAMIKTAKGGAIVNISSISALRPRGLTTYTTSKAAVIGLTQAMAVDHGRGLHRRGAWRRRHQRGRCKTLVEAALDRWGRLDFLDNNVGIGSRGSVVDEAPEQYRRVMQVNVETMFLLSKHAIPAMIQTAKGGAIVNISSISALRPRGLTTYTTSKAAIIGLTRAMAVDHGRDNIRVNCICPGPMYTPMVYARGMSEQARANRARASLLKTEGTGWDVGHAVKFLLSNFARYITGQVLVVDGGTTLQAPERESQEH